MVSVLMLSLVGTHIISIYPNLVRSSGQLKRHYQLVSASRYVSEYINRWAAFRFKHKLFSAYTVGEELEITGERRINRLLWADPLAGQSVPPDEALADNFKASMIFEDIDAITQDRAVLKILVWYDIDLADDVPVAADPKIGFTLIVTEKRN